VVTLAGDNDHEGNVHVGISSLEQCLHVRNLLLQNVGVLLLSNTIAEIENAGWETAVANRLHPVLDMGLQHGVDVVCLNHLHPVAVGLAGGSVTSAECVHRDSHGRHRSGLLAGSRMGNVRADYHRRGGEEASGSTRLGSNSAARSASELRVELHQYIGDVLALALLHMSELHALGDLRACVSLDSQKS